MKWTCVLLLLAVATTEAQAAKATAVTTTGPDAGFLDQYAATRRFQAGLPTTIRVTPGSEAVLFLRSGPRDFVQSLYEFDVASGKERVLLRAEDIQSRSGEEKLSAEERAHRERQRISSRGIVAYKLSEDGNRILVPLGGRLFLLDRETGDRTELKGSPGFPIDPQLSPDGHKAACVRNGDLYVIDVDSGREQRLTTGASETLRHGEAEFVAQEEMDRYTGYWWSPDSKQIAYEESDLSGVELLHILDPAHPEAEPNAFRYPRPGANNAVVRLGVIPVDGGNTTWVSWDRERYPYLCKVTWSGKAPLTLLVQNRTQTEEKLLAVDPPSGTTRELLVERDPAWIDLDPKMPRWLSDGSAFLWTTERHGARQLEERSPDGKLIRALTPVSFRMTDFAGLDESKRVAWVRGGEDPTERQVFRVSLDRDAATPEQVTTSPGVHEAEFAENGGVWVHTMRRMDAMPSFEVRGHAQESRGHLTSVAETPSIQLHASFQTAGPHDARAVILRPKDFRQGMRYPVIVSVYGGPTAQTVMQAMGEHVLQQWFANHGFIVVSIDGRGTPNRGRDWERVIKGDLIKTALGDQVEALHALARDHKEMDATRVGIYGWSFGGYFSAMAVMQRPDVFRVGVAGAPVVDWRDYDTFYTERYMGLPDANRAGYDSASVLTYAARLERPLLLVHGTVDDNVYFLHSMKLVDALFRAGKPFEFLPLAGFTHMVPDPVVTSRLYGRIESFFEDKLGKPTSAGS
jgi:dipeptidyl-peptidase-4